MWNMFQRYHKINDCENRWLKLETDRKKSQNIVKEHASFAVSASLWNREHRDSFDFIMSFQLIHKLALLTSFQTILE